ncbi:hypothetical protein QEN19_003161 [Hanseniaspora menglaensis]
MEFFWVIFENSQVVLYSLKQSSIENDENTRLLDYLLRETRKLLDNSRIHPVAIESYTVINDLLEFTLVKEKINNATVSERVVVLVTSLFGQKFKSKITANS